MRRGFTLVELSIVLIIIGLLIGGILVAQSMIKTATIQSQIKQIQQLDAAIINFQTKYNSLPGDSNMLPNPGNNDGNIDADATPATYDAAQFGYMNNKELNYFWIHLQQGVGIFPNLKFDNSCDGGCYCNMSFPNVEYAPAAISKNTGIVVAYDDYVYHTNYNAYTFMATGPASPYSCNIRSSVIPPISCDMIQAIDVKMDDGVETAGNVRGGISKTTFGNNVKFDCNGYTSPNLKGEMLIKILSQTGSGNN